MISFVTFKWKAPEGYRSKFEGWHVNALRDMVAKHYPDPHRFICIADDPAGIAKGVEVVPLWDDYADIPNATWGDKAPSCYRRLKVFSKEFEQIAGKRFCVMDLDVVITGDLRPLVNRPEDFVMWKDPGMKWPYNGSMMLMTAGARSQVWDDFDPATSPQEANAAGCLGSDQGWISYKLGKKEATWAAKDGVLSYRVDLGRGPQLPKHARVVVFHGQEDPWDEGPQHIRWVRENFPMPKDQQKKPAPQFKTLIGKHKGKTICVMGGAPTLQEEIKGVDAQAWISANEHGAKLRKVDYVVAMDDTHGVTQQKMDELIRQHTKAPIIGPWPHCDFILPDWPMAPKRVLSGVVAMWVAHCMGASEIILAGMDAYDGKPSAMKAYREMAAHINTKVTVAGDGHLSVIFPPNKEFEQRYPDPVLARINENSADMITVEARKPTNVGGRPLAKGEQMTGTRHEFRRLLKHNVLVEVVSANS